MSLLSGLRVGSTLVSLCDEATEGEKDGVTAVTHTSRNTSDLRSHKIKELEQLSHRVVQCTGIPLK